jgi:uncharacterized SAM-binding protein YcdF (DUF218 family)
MSDLPIAMIILGCSVQPDGQPSDWLRDRLEAALQHYCSHIFPLLPRRNANPQEPMLGVVLSGGLVSSQTVSEADCMLRWLEAKSAGVLAPEDASFLLQHCVLEQQALNTPDNLFFGCQLLATISPRWAKCVLVTSDFHVQRGRQLLEGELAVQSLSVGEIVVVGAPTPTLVGAALEARRARELSLIPKNLACQRQRHLALGWLKPMESASSPSLDQ